MPVYQPEACAVFRRARDPLGPLSNMAPGYPVTIGPLLIATSEHCYQASKVPSDLRATVLAAPGGVAAKAAAYELHSSWHPRWGEHREVIMQWVLATKLQQHADRLLPLLLDTSGRDIVEWSRADPFWGAVPGDGGLLAGDNRLGRLWGSLRAIVEGSGLKAVTNLAEAPPYFIGRFEWLGAP